MSEETFDFESLIEEAPVTADIGFERKLCMNAIMDKTFMRGVKSLLTDITLLESPLARSVMSWCIEYFNEYGKEMRHTIIGVYEQKRVKLSETVSKDINDFLESISQQYAQNDKIFNPEFELDQAAEYLGLRSVRKVKDKIDKHLLTNNLPKARQVINNFNVVKQVGVRAIDGFSDYSRFEKRKEKSNVLFKMAYPFNELYGDICTRHVSAVSAKSKVGKSREMAWFSAEAIRAGMNVFVASLEMSNEEFLSLIDLELLRMDIFGGEGHIPMIQGDRRNYSINYKKMEREGSTPDELKAHYDRLQKYCGYGRVFVANWPQKVCRIEDDLIPELDRLRTEEGISIQILTVDYADLLKENAGDERVDNRLKIGNQWKALKRLAEERHLHCHTASQLNRENLLAESASKEQDANFIIRLEQTGEEKDLGVYRLYVAFHRGIPYNPSRPLVSVSNNGIGLFNLDARWGNDDCDYMPDMDDDFTLWRSYEEDRYADVLDLYDFI